MDVRTDLMRMVPTLDVEGQAKILGIWIQEFKPCLIANFNFGWLLNVGVKRDGKFSSIDQKNRPFMELVKTVLDSFNI